MSRLFDELEDETEPTVGEEIGSALSPVLDAIVKSNAELTSAVEVIGKNNSDMAAMIGKSIETAIKTVESKQIDVTVNEKPNIRQWEFKIERDGNLLISRIIAIAKT